MHGVAILGHGVVGSGVAGLILKRGDMISEKTGSEKTGSEKTGEAIFLKKILDIRDFSHLSYSDLFTDNIAEILDDPDIKIIAEVMGGVSPAFEFVKEALEKKKSVVTSNKELVAEKGAVLLRTARENGVNFLFEASVGGGIPLIRTLHQGLAADRILNITGVLNGTTNFILTHMLESGMTFESALSLAQQKGFAEANPSADIEGLDTCRKICILASMTCGKNVSPKNIKASGIADITPDDMLFAKNSGYAIKLLGEFRLCDNDSCLVSTGPALIKSGSPLACVSDEFNAILIQGELTGDILISGKGAGKEPTAGAVVGDIIQCAIDSKPPPTLFWREEESEIRDISKIKSRWYIRFSGALSLEAKKALGEGVNFLTHPGKENGAQALITQPMTEAEADKALSGIKALSVSLKLPVRD